MKYDIKNLTLEEKLNLLTGNDIWRTYSANGKLPQIFMSDGPNGLRMHTPDGSTYKATAMPNLSLVGMTWDLSLAYLDGETIANDCIERGADVLLAPGVNIKRTPLNGRNFEYVSEDPFIAGLVGKAYIEGVQSKGIGTSLKHFCANNREFDRQSQTSEVDDRTLHEIYLAPFETAIKAKPWTVMCSYNPLNGVYPSENKKLLDKVLRGELGFDGVVVSDWGAVHNPYKAVKATLDIKMPKDSQTDNAEYRNLKAAYDKGLLTDEEIDFCVQNVLNLIEKTDNDKKTVNYTKAQRHENAVKIAKAGMVLLKNEDDVLPLKKGGNYAVIGALNAQPVEGGGGSAFVQTEYKQTPLHELLNQKLDTKISGGKFGFISKEGSETFFIRDLLKDMYGKDAAILCVKGETETEGRDRTGIKLANRYEKLISLACDYNENVIVLVYAGSAIDMSAWIDRVKAVVLVGFGGEATNEALASVLTGETNPSGKLTETFPLCIEDSFSGDDPGNGISELYSDGIFVGYRYYDEQNLDVLFPFGHGLSYSEFVYSDLKIEKKGDTDFVVSYTVKNDSDVDGAEVSQVYVRDVISMVCRPKKELKGFDKTYLKAHESKRISIPLDFRSFAYYNVALDKWHVENGVFEIYVGASSRDLRLKGKVEIELPDETQQSQRY